jgi:hypothetical protein
MKYKYHCYIKSRIPFLVRANSPDSAAEKFIQDLTIEDIEVEWIDEDVKAKRFAVGGEK